MTNEANGPQPQPRRRPVKTFLTVAALLGVGGLIGAGVVQAQMSDWGGPRWRDGWRGGDHWRGPRDDGHRMGGHRFERFVRFCNFETSRFHPVVRAYVKADLRLNDAQAKEFDALADHVLPAFEDVKRDACAKVATISDKAPEKLAQFSSVLRKAADAVDKTVEPARKFYASLEPSQQARVDELADRHRNRRWR